jgi:hypothetical protein
MALMVLKPKKVSALVSNADFKEGNNCILRKGNQ